MSAAEHYADRVAAFERMRDRWREGERDDQWAGGLAEQARADPRRAPDANLEALAAFVRPDDVLLDVGGGAGRVSLALALRCREVMCVDLSPAMRAEFEAAANVAGIDNARFIQSAWPAQVSVGQADVVLTTHVTYFVENIVPFVQALDAAARRRVIIGMWSIPPPMLGMNVYKLVFGGTVEPPPGYRELLPVLWELDLLPEVRVLPLPMRQNYTWRPQPTREQMMATALHAVQLHGRVEPNTARELIEAHFDDLFARDKSGYRPHWPETVRELLITWEVRR